MTHTDILETLDEAIDFVEGHSDGAPDASPESKRANYLVGQLRKARAEIVSMSDALKRKRGEHGAP